MSSDSQTPAIPKLTDPMKRHLVELLDAPYWTPGDRGEWAVARALHRRGLLDYHPYTGQKPFALNDEGRAVAERIRAEGGVSS